MFVFDERLATLFDRTRAMGADVDQLVAAGTLQAHQVDPAETGAGEFAYQVKQAVDVDGCRIVVIDSLNGYLHAMESEKQLFVQLHELLSYLGNRGVATILIMAQHGMTATMKSPVDVSYLADTVVLLRYFEARGRILKAISVLKKRSGAHENTIRELNLGIGGITVGAPLSKFTGVLAGVPTYTGTADDLAHD